MIPGCIPPIFISKKNSFGFIKTISSSITNYNLRSDALEHGWDGVSTLIANITISSSGILYATSTSYYAFDASGSYPPNSSLTITNNGIIGGKGGNGGSAGYWAYNGGGGEDPGYYYTVAPTGGSSGGPALRLGCPTTLINNGKIYSGGNGGSGTNAYDAGYDAGGETGWVSNRVNGSSGGSGASTISTGIVAATGNGSTWGSTYAIYKSGNTLTISTTGDIRGTVA